MIDDSAHEGAECFTESTMIDRARHTMQTFLKNYYRATVPRHMAAFREKQAFYASQIRCEEALIL